MADPAITAGIDEFGIDLFTFIVQPDGTFIVECEEPYDDDAETFSVSFRPNEALGIAKLIASRQGFALAPIPALRASEV